MIDDRLDYVEKPHIDSNFALLTPAAGETLRGVRHEGVGEARAPHDVVEGVRGARLHDGRKGLVEGLQKHQNLHARVPQRLRGLPEKYAVFVDGVYHSPGQRKEYDSIALEVERIVPPRSDTVDVFKAADHDL